MFRITPNPNTVEIRTLVILFYDDSVNGLQMNEFSSKILGIMHVDRRFGR